MHLRTLASDINFSITSKFSNQHLKITKVKNNNGNAGSAFERGIMMWYWKAYHVNTMW